MRHVERRPKLGQAFFYLFGSLPISFGGRRDPECAQQVRCGPARVPGLSEHRVQPLVGQMAEDEVDDAPGIEGFYIGGPVAVGPVGVGLGVDVHAP